MKLSLIGIVALLIFIIMARTYETSFGNMLDEWAHNIFGGNEFLEAFHVIGNTEFIFIITLTFAVFLILLKKAWKSALFSILTVAIGDGLNRWLKGVFERPRPPVIDQLTSYSFPSGHSMLSTIYLLVFAFIINQHFFSGQSKKTLYVIAFIVALLIALSRVAGERHYFTDIIAGMSLGVAFVITSVAVYKKLVR